MKEITYLKFKVNDFDRKERLNKLILAGPAVNKYLSGSLPNRNSCLDMMNNSLKSELNESIITDVRKLGNSNKLLIHLNDIKCRKDFIAAFTKTKPLQVLLIPVLIIKV